MGPAEGWAGEWERQERVWEGAGNPSTPVRSGLTWHRAATGPFESSALAELISLLSPNIFLHSVSLLTSTLCSPSGKISFISPALGLPPSSLYHSPDTYCIAQYKAFIHLLTPAHSFIQRPSAPFRSGHWVTGFNSGHREDKNLRTSLADQRLGASRLHFRGPGFDTRWGRRRSVGRLV